MVCEQCDAVSGRQSADRVWGDVIVCHNDVAVDMSVAVAVAAVSTAVTDTARGGAVMWLSIADHICPCSQSYFPCPQCSGGVQLPQPFVIPLILLLQLMLDSLDFFFLEKKRFAKNYARTQPTMKDIATNSKATSVAVNEPRAPHPATHVPAALKMTSGKTNMAILDGVIAPFSCCVWCNARCIARCTLRFTCQRHRHYCHYCCV